MNSANFRLGAAAATLAIMAIPGVSVAESFALATHGGHAGMEYSGDQPEARFAGRHFPQVPSRADAGLADAKVDWSSLAPYVGMGFGNSMNAGRWSFAFDLGVMFTGLLDFARSGSTHLEVREQFNPEDPLSDEKYYPVLSLALAYRF